MPKHKKTREQKRKADARKSESFIHIHQESGNASPLYSFSSRSKLSEPLLQPATHANTNIALVQHDLKKTAFISLVITAAQILFFFLLKNHLLAISFARY